MPYKSVSTLAGGPKTASALVYSIPMAVSSTVRQNGLENKLSDYMSSVLFSYRLGIINSLNTNRVAHIALAGLVGYFVYKAVTKSAYERNIELLKKKDSLHRRSFKESQSVRLGQTTVVIQPIIVNLVSQIKDVKPGFIKKFINAISFEEKVVYEKHPTIIYEVNEEQKYDKYLSKSNYLRFDAINGTVNIKVIVPRNKKGVELTTTLDSIPSRNISGGEIKDLAMLLKSLRKA